MHNKSYEFIIQTRKDDIDFINKIMEAYEGVGVVRTVDPQKGIIDIIVTEDFIDDARMIINDLNNRHAKAEIIQEAPWSGELH